MRLPLYLICAALVAAVKGEREAGDVQYGRRLQPLDLTADQETINYLLPKLAAKYRPGNDWNGVADPRFYLLTETAQINDVNQDFNQDFFAPEGRIKRTGLTNGPSLSIVNSLDVLRNRLLLEIARKKQLEGMNRNRNLLSTVGKRAQMSHAKHDFGYGNNL